MVGGDFQIRGLYARNTSQRTLYALEETFKLEGYTPEAGEPLFSGVLEETFKLK